MRLPDHEQSNLESWLLRRQWTPQSCGHQMRDWTHRKTQFSTKTELKMTHCFYHFGDSSAKKFHREASAHSSSSATPDSPKFFLEMNKAIKNPDGPVLQQLPFTSQADPLFPFLSTRNNTLTATSAQDLHVFLKRESYNQLKGIKTVSFIHEHDSRADKAKPAKNAAFSESPEAIARNTAGEWKGNGKLSY